MGLFSEEDIAKLQAMTDEDWNRIEEERKKELQRLSDYYNELNRGLYSGLVLKLKLGPKGDERNYCLALQNPPGELGSFVGCKKLQPGESVILIEDTKYFDFWKCDSAYGIIYVHAANFDKSELNLDK
jgi:hypothetical protein